MLTYVKGDLIQLAKNGYFDCIIHGCNCFCVMGAGIAKSIAQSFPEAYVVDKKTKAGSKSKLGTFTETTIIGFGSKFVVINAYTQYDYKRNNKNDINVSYSAISKVFKSIKETYGKKDLKFGIPLIGAGLAGGNWDKIYKLIDEVMNDEDVTIVQYNQRR